MKKTSLLLLLLVLIIQSGQVAACSMFKVTEGGKTLVGNNEDYWNPNTRVWFERGEMGRFGAVYVGFDNLYPQGGMNDAGLVFDGFAMDYLAVTDTTGKKSLSTQEELFSFVKNILQTCSTVGEVKATVQEFNLEHLHSSLLFFVDKSGKYLIVEGDSLTIGDDPTYIQSNFYPSCTQNNSEVNIDFYQKGRAYLADNSANTSLAYCSNMMNAMHQDWGVGGTLYTTIYDLESGTIHLYYHSDFETVVSFNLKEELEKGNHAHNIPDLFPENVEGQSQLATYNKTNSLIELLDAPGLADDAQELARTLAMVAATKPDFRFESTINMMGYKWIREHKNLPTAIRIFELNCELYPRSSNVFDSLGEAYMANGQNAQAIKMYKKSYKLNKGNTHALVQIAKLKSLD